MTDQRPTIEYFFSFISLWSYVGSLAFQDIVAKRAATVVFKPVDLLAVFAAGGGKPVRQRALPRQSYRIVEMQRWRAIRNIPLVIWPKFYPVDPSLGHRMLLAAIADGSDVSAFVHACLKGVWADELNIADADTLVRLADASGLDGAHLLARQGEVEFNRREAQLTREAIDRPVFGAPFYFLHDEPFWGQDRLDHLDQAIASRREPIRWPTPGDL
jgi:2-hydroxychromene-2-carboxylate isomerase